jgi:predicted CoA-substrate-specific enzyme activase
VVGEFIDADLIIDEITAHARGAVQFEPQVDTIIEIGGQDSKYISLTNRHPLDFDMNKVCAAGTGSFLHELANKYGINIVDEFQEIALSSDSPILLTERCTVFMESDLSAYHQKGVAVPDLMAGLCYAIVYNYLNRVVGRRKIGQRVMFLGGPSLNKAVVAAFEQVLGRGLIVPQNREVLGAYGAAVCAQETMRATGLETSRFRGLQSSINDALAYREKVCRADPECHNQCKLKIYDFDGRRSIWGGECGRYERTQRDEEKKEDIFRLRQKLWEKYMAGVCSFLQDRPLMEMDGRPTVGMQNALYGHQTGILWAHFFDALGFRMVMSPPTNTQHVNSGVEYAVDGACFPVKVSHGHVMHLAGNTAFLFLPSLIDMPTPRPAERGCYCPMVSSNSYMVRAGLGLESRNLLKPVLCLKNDPGILALELARQLKSKLGVSKAAIKKAFTHALHRQEQFVSDVHRRGRQLLSNHRDEEPLVIVTGRPYNLFDARLNLRLGQNLAKIGLAALPMDFVDVSGVDLEGFSSVYWGLGARILRTALWIKRRPNCFGLHLTNFGCGADSFIEHFYKHIMGERPFLILELDEHSAVAGVKTRIEAFQHVVANSLRAMQVDHHRQQKKAG